MTEVDEFLAMKSAQTQQNTIAAYARDLRNFLSYFAERGKKEPALLSEEELMEYIFWSRERLSGISLCRRISVLKSFYAFLAEKGAVAVSPLANLRGRNIEKKAPDILSVREVQKILAVPDEGGAKGIRNRAMLEFLYATGIRISEMIALNLEDYSPEAGTVTCGEMRRLRTIALYPQAMREMNSYLEFSRPVYCTNPAERALFVNAEGERITRQGIWKILHACAEEAGIDRNISPHTFRHSFAAHLLENGADAKKVWEILGNTDGSTIKVYVKEKKAKAKGDAIALHPRAKG